MHRTCFARLMGVADFLEDSAPLGAHIVGGLGQVDGLGPAVKFDGLWRSSAAEVIVDLDGVVGAVMGPVLACPVVGSE